MNVSVDFDVDIRCVGCGETAKLPDGDARRILHSGGVIYADVDRRCACGSRRVRVSVKFDGGDQAENPERGQAP